MRKASAIALVVVGLAVPAAIIAGLCANLPCCVRAVDAAGSLNGEDCSPVACATSPAQDRIQPGQATSLVFAGMLQGTLSAPLPASPPIAVASVSHAPPASCHDRLTLLSTLLI